METAVAAYKLHVRVGNAEFKAIGREEAVKDQFDLFMGVVGSIPGAISNGSNGQFKKPAPLSGAPAESGLPEGYHDQFEGEETPAESNGSVPSITKELLDRAFRIEGNSVSLRVLPHGKNADADALLLLVYGYHALRGQNEVGAHALTASARQSGVALARIDRTLGRMKTYIMRGGRAAGTRYTITNQGILAGEKMLADLFK